MTTMRKVIEVTYRVDDNVRPMCPECKHTGWHSSKCALKDTDLRPVDPPATRMKVNEDGHLGGVKVLVGPLLPTEAILIAHIRGDLHYGPDCAWCRETGMLADLAVKARQAQREAEARLNSVITGG